LNHLKDLTLNPDYADICGLTQDEVEYSFEPEIANILHETGNSREIYMQQLKDFYNGYRFSKEPVTLYNPFGLLNHFDNSGEFNSYWYNTGTPTFLISLIKTQKIDILQLGEMSFDMSQFQKFDIESLDAMVVLYQSGYLTISEYIEEIKTYKLDYPNLEVRSSFAQSLIKTFYDIPANNTNALIYKLPANLIAGDVDGIITVLRSFLAEVPYKLIRDTENYYQTVFHLIFNMLGLNCRSEVETSCGRVDAVVKTKDFVYIFEFKFNESAEKALAQIDRKDYPLPWSAGSRKIIKVGVCFDGEKRNISEWLVVGS
jgi:hypothetical protein